MNNPFLKFKDWLTLSEAAKQLAVVWKYEVTEADILQFALNGHLKLSINLVNATTARYGKIIRTKDLDDATAVRYFNNINIEDMDNAKLAQVLNIHDYKKLDLVALVTDAKARYTNKISPDAMDWDEFRKELLTGNIIPIGLDDRKTIPLPNIIGIEDSQFLKLSNEVTIIQSVWDLPMIGSERHYIESRYLKIIDGPQPLVRDSPGACVRGQNGEIYQFQNKLGYNEYYPNSIMELAELKRLRDNKSISLGKATKELSRHQRQRESFERESNALAFSTPADSRYFRAACWPPQDSVLVVRIKAMIEFEPLIDALNYTNGAEDRQQTDSHPDTESPPLKNKKTSKRGKTKITVFLTELCQKQDINELSAEILVRSIKPLEGKTNSPVKKYHGFYDEVCVEWNSGAGSTKGSWGKKAFQNFVTDYKKDNQ